MSPAQKLQAAMRLYWSARALKAAALRAEHPDWPEEAIAAAVRKACTMNDLFTLFTSPFEAAGIDAVVTGSVAAMLYGEP